MVAFLTLCNYPPTYPTAAALAATYLWWCLVAMQRHYLARIIIAAALLYEIGQLLLASWYLVNPLKA